jgi:glyoxylate reductase
MWQKVLVPWAMPKPGLDILQSARADIMTLHGSKGEPPTLEALIESVRHVDVLISRGGQPTPRAVIIANPSLRGIANYGVGYDNIDIVAATEFGIPVTNTPHVLTETTADLAWALLMATARKIPLAHQYAVANQWGGPGGEQLWGLDIGPGGANRLKILGIVGLGRIGMAVMRRSRGFRMKVIAYDPYRREIIDKTRGVEYREIDDLLRDSDYVTLHCPLTTETRHLIGKRELDLMKPTAILINTARGPLVDERALVSVLERGGIAGAGLDVYEEEPRISPGLLKLKNVVLLPHIGSATRVTREQMAIMAAKNAVAMLKGKRPPQVVNPEVFGSPEYAERVSALTALPAR